MRVKSPASEELDLRRLLAPKLAEAAEIQRRLTLERIAAEAPTRIFVPETVTLTTEDVCRTS